MSEDADQHMSRGRCSVCLRSMPLRLDGLIRVHGPRRSRCPGSDQPPGSDLTTVSQSMSSSPVDPCPRVPSPRSPHTTSSNLEDVLSLLKSKKVKTLKRIPRGCRNQAARKFDEILANVICVNDQDCWARLFRFSRSCLACPGRGGRRWSLSKLVSRQIIEESLSVWNF